MAAHIHPFTVREYLHHNILFLKMFMIITLMLIHEEKIKSQYKNTPYYIQSNFWFILNSL